MSFASHLYLVPWPDFQVRSFPTLQRGCRLQGQLELEVRRYCKGQVARRISEISTSFLPWHWFNFFWIHFPRSQHQPQPQHQHQPQNQKKNLDWIYLIFWKTDVHQGIKRFEILDEIRSLRSSWTMYKICQFHQGFTKDRGKQCVAIPNFVNW